jgi:hypothetical protein
MPDLLELRAWSSPDLFGGAIWILQLRKTLLEILQLMKEFIELSIAYLGSIENVVQKAVVLHQRNELFDSAFSRLKLVRDLRAH